MIHDEQCNGVCGMNPCDDGPFVKFVDVAEALTKLDNTRILKLCGLVDKAISLLPYSGYDDAVDVLRDVSAQLQEEAKGKKCLSPLPNGLVSGPTPRSAKL
jgi:hypothetical protein